ncbi:hypothetical protein CFP56_013074 [Quercus suber]|uniref:Uncharacterized protein n=1 Tax=Quercus suber TaxID=58331 RepID=A0AAW0M3D0_QUESU
MEEVVVQNLFNGAREAMIEAARELNKHSSKQRHNLAERDYEAIEAALFALLCLTIGSEQLVYSSTIISNFTSSVHKTEFLNIIQIHSSLIVEFVCNLGCL